MYAYTRARNRRRSTVRRLQYCWSWPGWNSNATTQCKPRTSDIVTAANPVEIFIKGQIFELVPDLFRIPRRRCEHILPFCNTRRAQHKARRDWKRATVEHKFFGKYVLQWNMQIILQAASRVFRYPSAFILMVNNRACMLIMSRSQMFQRVAPSTFPSARDISKPPTVGRYDRWSLHAYRLVRYSRDDKKRKS